MKYLPRSLARAFHSKSQPLHQQTFIFWLTLLGLTLLAGGCATPADKFDTLDRSLRGYEKAVRWGKFDIAYTFYRSGDDQQLIAPQYLKDIRVTRYEVNSRDFNSETMTTKQIVTISYYHMDTQRERSITDTQNWEYDKEKKRWFIVSEPPSFQ